MIRSSRPSLTSRLRPKSKVNLVVGLDVGTSCMKAAFRELGAVSRRIVPISFGHKLQGYPAYCYPSVGCVTADRRFLWGPEAVRKLDQMNWSSGIRRLKVLVAGESDAEFRDSWTADAYEQYLSSLDLDPGVFRPAYLFAAALARQMRVVHDLLRLRYQAGVELDLRFNICVPIDHYQNNELLGVYHRINHVAEQLYISPDMDVWEVGDLIEIAAAKYDEACPTERQDGRVFAVPEAMAEVAGYLTSLAAQEGIHAMLDIGAGTSDLSVFNLRGASTANRECAWYAARNIPRGAVVSRVV